MTLTEKQLVKALKGQGGAGQPVVQPAERLALAVTYDLSRPRADSREVNFFLASRKEQRPGTIQLLMIVQEKKFK